jgi:hypothetical protein
LIETGRENRPAQHAPLRDRLGLQRGSLQRCQAILVRDPGFKVELVQESCVAASSKRFLNICFCSPQVTIEPPQDRNQSPEGFAAVRGLYGRGP